MSTNTQAAGRKSIRSRPEVHRGQTGSRWEERNTFFHLPSSIQSPIVLAVIKGE